MCDCSVVQEERGSGTKRDKWDGLEGGDTTATNLHPTVGQSALGWALSLVKPISVHFPFFIRMTELAVPADSRNRCCRSNFDIGNDF